MAIAHKTKQNETKQNINKNKETGPLGIIYV